VGEIGSGRWPGPTTVSRQTDRQTDTLLPSMTDTLLQGMTDTLLPSMTDTLPSMTDTLLRAWHTLSSKHDSFTSPQRGNNTQAPEVWSSTRRPRCHRGRQSQATPRLFCCPPKVFNRFFAVQVFNRLFCCSLLLSNRLSAVHNRGPTNNSREGSNTGSLLWLAQPAPHICLQSPVRRSLLEPESNINPVSEMMVGLPDR